MATRRTFTAEFKQSAIRLVTEQKHTAKQAAMSLGIGEATLRYWLKTRRSGDAAAVMAEDRTLRRRVRELETQNQRLQLERDILKKAAAFFARESS